MPGHHLETRTILTLALPAFLTQASYTITNVVDLMMIGSLSPAAIAAVGVGGILFWNLIVLTGGPVMAAGYLCAQSYGAGKFDDFARRGSMAILISFLLALPLALGNKGFAVLLYRIMGTDEEVVLLGALYFRYRLIGLPIELLNSGLEGMIKATGDTRRPMIIRFISHLSNVFFNYLLIFGKLGLPALGAEGAGLATMISYFIAFILFIALSPRLLARKIPVRLLQKPDRFNGRLVVKEGVKITGNELSGSLSFFVYTAVVASLGATALAANEIGLNITSTAFMPAIGFGQAALILIGQRVGKGETATAKKTGWEVQLYCAVFMVAMGVLFFIIPETIGRFYTRDQEVLATLTPMLRFAAFFQIFDGGQIIFSFCLRATGDTTFLFLANLLGSWLLFIPGVLLIVHILKLNVIWAWGGMYCFMLALFIIYGIRYMTMKWDRIKAK
ncbi:MAG: MATE family efflux transporter [Spirochaetales bacterium]|nr:MATE family efflux transporter [Spirochaetales bacterium]